MCDEFWQPKIHLELNSFVCTILIKKITSLHSIHPPFSSILFSAFFFVYRPTKSKIWRYFRLSSRRSDSDNKLETQRSAENSITQENTTETMDIEAKIPLTRKSAVNIKSLSKQSMSTTKQQNLPNASTHGKISKKSATNSDNRMSSKSTKNLRKELSTNKMRAELSHSIEEVNNSCSNITASTFVNENGVSTSSGICLDFESGAHIERKSICDRDSVFSGASSNDRYSQRSNDMLSEAGNLTRRESSSTYEQDMDIIDLLERERSMNIQDMMERERRTERMRKKQAYGNRSNRKLPDLTKITTPNSPKRAIVGEQTTNFPNFVFTHQYNEFAEARTNRNRDLNAISSRNNSLGSFGKRNSDAYKADDDDMSRRKQSIESRKSSTKSIRDSRGVHSSGKYVDASYANNL